MLGAFLRVMDRTTMHRENQLTRGSHRVGLSELRRQGLPQKAMYNSKRWQAERREQLRKNPLCSDYFGVHGISKEPATIVDHIKPHKGDKVLFWDPNNRQSMCKPCHDRKTVEEDGGFGRKVKNADAVGVGIF